jgi:hypothetical protein
LAYDLAGVADAVELWKDADADLQPKVGVARAKIRRRSETEKR